MGPLPAPRRSALLQFCPALFPIGRRALSREGERNLVKSPLNRTARPARLLPALHTF